MNLLVDPQGNLRCLYTELIDLSGLGCPVITRASSVEPGPDGLWWADLKPVNGPCLGPFPRRSEALRAEQEWLESNWFLEHASRQRRDDPLPEQPTNLFRPGKSDPTSLYRNGVRLPVRLHHRHGNEVQGEPT